MSQSTNPGGGNVPIPGQGLGGQANPGISASFTPTNANTLLVGNQVIKIQPDEEVVALTEMGFRVLLEGDVGGTRAGRDMCLGFFISGLVGLIGLIAATWNDIFSKGEWGWAIWIVVMLAIVAGSAVGAAICGYRHYKILNDSPYSNLVTKLKKHFGMISR